jgi:hypothetical protein
MNKVDGFLIEWIADPRGHGLIKAVRPTTIPKRVL